MTIRLGELLFERGILTRDQVEAILEQQQQKARPFGVLAEEMFGISPEEIEQAWAEQYSRLTPDIELDDEAFADQSLAIIHSRRQILARGVLTVGLMVTALVLTLAMLESLVWQY